MYCRVLRFEFETSRQLKIRALLVLLSLMVAIAGFVVLLMVRSILVGYSKMMPLRKCLLMEYFCLKVRAPALPGGSCGMDLQAAVGLPRLEQACHGNASF